MTLRGGATIGRYRVEELIGSGGMATVYKAYEPSLDRIVALKVIRPELAAQTDLVARFRLEAQVIARLTHPNIVQVHAFDEIDEQLVLAMTYLDGGTLRDRVAALGGRLARSETVSIVAQVADALAYAHRKGIVHRDVKPSNVMFSEERAVVTDFGIAKIVGGAAMTQTGVGIGTPEYMAPEQGAGRPVEQSADIYALGVVAYELLTGRVPFIADTPFAVVAAQMRDPLPSPRSFEPTLTDATERALSRALEKDPGRRFPSATEFAAALRDSLAVEETRPTVVTKTPAHATGRRPLVPWLLASWGGRAALAAVALGLLVAGGTAFSALLGGGSPDTRSAPELASLAPVTTAPLAVPAGTFAAVSTTTIRTATPPPTPKFAVPSKGKLLFSAPLADPDPGFDPFVAGGGSPGDITARASGGTLDIALAKGNMSATSAWTFGAPTFSYIIELEISFTPGSSGVLYRTQLKQGSTVLGGGFIGLDIRGTGDTAIVYWNQSQQALTALTPRVPVPQLATGAAVAVAVVLDGDKYTLYVDQRQVAQVTDPRGVRGVRPTLEITTGDSGGSMRISGARVYGLP